MLIKWSNALKVEALMSIILTHFMVFFSAYRNTTVKTGDPMGSTSFCTPILVSTNKPPDHAQLATIMQHKLYIDHHKETMDCKLLIIKSEHQYSRSVI